MAGHGHIDDTWRYHRDCPRDGIVSDKPHFDDLDENQRLAFGNGVGPGWLPDWARMVITGYASWFVGEASWKHHDFNYGRGFTEADRLDADRMFREKMLEDVAALSFPKRLLAWFTIAFFYRAVRRYGSRSFFYCNRYRTLDEMIATIGTGRRKYEHVMPDGLERGWKEDKARALRQAGLREN